MTQPKSPRILATSIASYLQRPFDEGENLNDGLDDGPEAPWSDLASKIGQEAPEVKPNTNNPNLEPEKKAEDKTKETKPDDETDPSKVTKKEDEEEDPELKKFQPHPHAPQEQVTQFKALKTQTKAYKSERDTALAEATRLKSELEQVKAGSDPKLQDEIKTLREENEKLKQLSMVVEEEGSAEFKAKYVEPISQAQNSLKDLLTSWKMPANLVEEALKQGDNWARWEETKKHLKDWQREELDEARRSIRKASREKDQALAKLRDPAERGKYLEEKTKNQEAETKNFWHKTGQEAQKLIDANGKHHVVEEIPKDATEDQKKAIEAKNEIIRTRNKTTSELLGKAINAKDPVSLATLAFRTANSFYLEDQVKDLEAKLAAMTKRADEAESKIGKAKKMGSDTTRAATGVKKAVEESTGEESAEEAMDRAKREFAGKA